jgi:hypothetical protein
MSVDLMAPSLLAIEEGDLCAILTDHFCARYGPFNRLRVAYVHKTPTGGFEITFEPKPQPEPEEKK